MERDFSKFYTGNRKTIFVLMIICFALFGVFNNSFWIVMALIISVSNLAAIKELHKEAKENDRLYK